MHKFFISLVSAALVALATPALASSATVKVKDDFFQAKTVRIKSGQTVTWKWVGSNPHNVIAGFLTKKQKKTRVNGSISHRFKARGTFRYHCSIHSGMNGKVVVS
jgi:plastocyanin